MRNKRTYSIVFLLGLLCLCVMSVCNARSLRGTLENVLFHQGEKYLADGDYYNAIRFFEQMEADFPFGAHIRQAQLNLLYAYYQNGDYASTVAAAARFVRLYPRSENVDYAYYIKGIASYQQNRTIFQKIFYVDPADRDLSGIRAAFLDFRMLLTLFPHSPYAPDAHQRMIYLRDVLAAHEVDVAKYYWRREAYVAAANRASFVVRHYQHAPTVKDALIVMVKSYRALHETDLENEALHVLDSNFPRTSVKRAILR